MMKRILCLALCLMLAMTVACAETADTLQKKFVRQLTGGNGVRGKISLTASGNADWLNILLPFTAADIQLRAIGQKQGDMSANVSDDDDWQIKLYAENSEGNEAGTTWVYGDPEGIYFASDLLPGTVLKMPVEQVNLLYQVFKGEFMDLFFAFDPFTMTTPGKNGNVAAYEAVAGMLGISEQDWADKWMPVLEKYFLHLDLWLTSYGDPSFMTGDSGPMTLSATYTIPAADLKKEAKYLIGQMLFDNDLQTLLLPYVTLEQRVTYLNPSLVYFYEACIDQLPLEGDVILAREMSAMGETVSTTVSLPLPPLPDNLTGPVGELAAMALELPYTDLLLGADRVAFTQSGAERNISISGEKRTITLTSTESYPDEETTELTGSLKITPNVGVDENSLSAAYTTSWSHKLWQDDNYLDHDMSTFSLSVAPDLAMLSEDDPFRRTYVDFSPISLDLNVDYRNNSFQEGSAVQINVTADAKLPDAKIGLDMVLRITTKLAMSPLSTAGAQSAADLSDEEQSALLAAFVVNADQTMSGLNVPAAEPTAVPPVNE